MKRTALSLCVGLMLALSVNRMLQKQGSCGYADPHTFSHSFSHGISLSCGYPFHYAGCHLLSGRRQHDG